MFCRIQLQSAWNVGVSCLSGFLTSFARRTFLVVSASTDHSAWNLFRCKRTQVWNEWNKIPNFIMCMKLIDWIAAIVAGAVAVISVVRRHTFSISPHSMHRWPTNECKYMEAIGSFVFFPLNFQTDSQKTAHELKTIVRMKWKRIWINYFEKKNTFQIEAAWNGNQMERCIQNEKKKKSLTCFW